MGETRVDHSPGSWARSTRPQDAWGGAGREDFLVLFDPLKNFRAGGFVVGAGHGVAGSVPEVCTVHDLGHREILHGFPRRDIFVAVPGVFQNQGEYSSRERTKGEHARLGKESV